MTNKKEDRTKAKLSSPKAKTGSLTKKKLSYGLWHRLRQNLFWLLFWLGLHAFFAKKEQGSQAQPFEQELSPDIASKLQDLETPFQGKPNLNDNSSYQLLQLCKRATQQPANEMDDILYYLVKNICEFGQKYEKHDNNIAMKIRQEPTCTKEVIQEYVQEIRCSRIVGFYRKDLLNHLSQRYELESQETLLKLYNECVTYNTSNILEAVVKNTEADILSAPDLINRIRCAQGTLYGLHKPAYQAMRIFLLLRATRLIQDRDTFICQQGPDVGVVFSCWVHQILPDITACEHGIARDLVRNTVSSSRRKEFQEKFQVFADRVRDQIAEYVLKEEDEKRLLKTLQKNLSSLPDDDFIEIFQQNLPKGMMLSELNCKNLQEIWNSHKKDLKKCLRDLCPIKKNVESLIQKLQPSFTREVLPEVCESQLERFYCTTQLLLAYQTRYPVSLRGLQAFGCTLFKKISLYKSGVLFLQVLGLPCANLLSLGLVTYPIWKPVRTFPAQSLRECIPEVVRSLPVTFAGFIGGTQASELVGTYCDLMRTSSTLPPTPLLNGVSIRCV